MGATGLTTGWVLPWKVLRVAVELLAPLLLLGVLAAWASGSEAVVWAALGAVTILTSAVHGPDMPRLVAHGVLVVVAAAIGAWGADSAAASAAAVVLVSAIQVFPNRWSAGALSLLPVLASFAGASGLDAHVGTAALWSGLGVLVMGTHLRVRRVALPREPVPRGRAVRHAVALALTAGVAQYLVVRADLTHGYWLVLALAAVLRPVAGTVGRAAWERVLGTVGGVLAAAAVVMLLPPAVSVPVGALCLVYGVGFVLVGDGVKSALFTALAVVLLSSSGLAGVGAGLAEQRLVFTLVGAATAVLVALVLDALDQEPDPAQTGD